MPWAKATETGGGDNLGRAGPTFLGLLVVVRRRGGVIGALVMVSATGERSHQNREKRPSHARHPRPLRMPYLLSACAAAETTGRGTVRTGAVLRTPSRSWTLRVFLKRAGITSADSSRGDATRKAITFHDLRAIGVTWCAARRRFAPDHAARWPRGLRGEPRAFIREFSRRRLENRERVGREPYLSDGRPRPGCTSRSPRTHGARCQFDPCGATLAASHAGQVTSHGPGEEPHGRPVRRERSRAVYRGPANMEEELSRSSSGRCPRHWVGGASQLGDQQEGHLARARRSEGVIAQPRRRTCGPRASPSSS